MQVMRNPWAKSTCQRERGWRCEITETGEICPWCFPRSPPKPPLPTESRLMDAMLVVGGEPPGEGDQ
jgi:hypothetical protein